MGNCQTRVQKKTIGKLQKMAFQFFYVTFIVFYRVSREEEDSAEQENSDGEELSEEAEYSDEDQDLEGWKRE